MKKKIVLVMLLIVMLSAMLISACGSSDSGSSNNTGSNLPAGSNSNTNNNTEENKPSDSKPDEKVEEVAWEEGEAIVTVWTNSIDTKWIQIMMPITNTGSKSLYFNSAKLDLEDEAGHLLESMDYISFHPDILLPGETGWVYEETIYENDIDPAKVIAHISFDEAKVDCIRLEISDLDIRGDDYGDITVTGRVENTTDEEQTMVEIVAFLYDENNVLIGMATTLESSIKAGDKMGFSASTFSLPDSVTIDMVARYEVVAYPFQLQW